LDTTKITSERKRELYMGQREMIAEVYANQAKKKPTPAPTEGNPTDPPVNETTEAQKAREEAAAKKRQAERDEKNWWTQPFEDSEAWGIIGRLAAGASIVGPVAALLKWIFGGKQQPPQQ
jgi:hypothetical protein